LETKNSQYLELFYVNFGRYFSQKMRPTPKKYRPSGETSPNRVTLDLGTIRQRRQKKLCFLMLKGTIFFGSWGWIRKITKLGKPRFISK
jgi:hypothetical protein